MGFLMLQRQAVAWLLGASALAMAFRPRVVVDGYTLDRHVQALLALGRRQSNRGAGGGAAPMPDVPGLRRMLAVMPELTGVDADGRVTTRDLGRADGVPVPMRLFTPPDSRVPGPLLVFLHGGGWIAGSVATYDRLCRHIAAEGGLRVLSIEYRLAPEYPFPAGFDDANAALAWAMSHMDELGADRVAIGGDSAGGGLAAGVCVARAAAGQSPPALLWLLYPALDLLTEHPSLRTMDGYVFTRAALDWIVERYVPAEADRADPRASPGLAAVDGLPRADVTVAGFDPLRDAGIAFAARMGGRATLRVAEGMTHGFADSAGAVPGARVAFDAAIAGLRRGVAA